MPANTKLDGQTQPHNCCLTFSIVFVTIYVHCSRPQRVISIVRFRSRRYWMTKSTHENTSRLDFDSICLMSLSLRQTLFMCISFYLYVSQKSNSAFSISISKCIYFICLTHSLSLSIFVYFHRRGLTPPHRVKSISMATFTTEEIEFINSHGNELCAKTWLGLWDPKRVHTQDQRELMIDKYERKR